MRLGQYRAEFGNALQIVVRSFLAVRLRLVNICVDVRLPEFM